MRKSKRRASKPKASKPRLVPVLATIGGGDKLKTAIQMDNEFGERATEALDQVFGVLNAISNTFGDAGEATMPDRHLDAAISAVITLLRSARDSLQKYREGVSALGAAS